MSYQTGVVAHYNWRVRRGLTPCGGSSTVEYTGPIRKFLLDMIKKYKILSMADVGCGDFSWMKLMEFPKQFRYIGYDVNEELILANRANKLYRGSFKFFDAVVTVMLPANDLIFCKDVLFHYKNRDISRILKNFRASGSKYLMTNYSYMETSNPDRWRLRRHVGY